MSFVLVFVLFLNINKHAFFQHATALHPIPLHHTISLLATSLLNVNTLI